MLRDFEDAGAMPLVFKGAALAHTHYTASWDRPRYDADVLVTTESRGAVFAILQTRGYRKRPFISGDLVMYQAPFERRDHLGIEHALDIHWRVANPQLVSQFVTHDELVERSTTVNVEGHPMRVPSAVDSLLVACVHRVAHHPDFQKAIWVRDIHLLATGLDLNEWSMFVGLARRKSVRAICAEGLKLAQERCQTRVPCGVMTALTTGEDEPSAVFLRRKQRPIDRLASDFRALGPRAAARLMREHLLPPAEYMEAKYGVTSRTLLPAYYVKRVLTGMSKWFASGPPEGGPHV